MTKTEILTIFIDKQLSFTAIIPIDKRKPFAVKDTRSAKPYPERRNT